MIYNIVLTGGACSGKSSSLNNIKQYFNNYKVITVPETASLLLSNNINMGKLTKEEMLLVDAEILKFKQQFYFAYNNLAKLNNQKTIIIYDRAELDAMIYHNKKDFINLLNSFNLDIEKIYNQSNLVVHLQSVAVDKPELYNNDNPTRWENTKQAACFDKELVKVWNKHYNYHLIDNSSNFEDKVDKLIKIIENNLNF